MNILLCLLAFVLIDASRTAQTSLSQNEVSTQAELALEASSCRELLPVIQRLKVSLPVKSGLQSKLDDLENMCKANLPEVHSMVRIKMLMILQGLIIKPGNALLPIYNEVKKDLEENEKALANAQADHRNRIKECGGVKTCLKGISSEDVDRARKNLLKVEKIAEYIEKVEKKAQSKEATVLLGTLKAISDQRNH